MAISTIDSKGLTSPLTSGVTTNTVTSAAATALTLQSAGTTGLVISTAGQVTRPNQVACLVRTSGNDNYTTPNTYQKVALNTVINQTGSSFNTSTNRFTAPVDGWYLFNSTIYMYPVPFVDTAYYKNGTAFLRYGSINATTNVNPNGSSFSTMMYLVANDYIELYVQSNVTATIYQGSPYTTFLSACLLG